MSFFSMQDIVSRQTYYIMIYYGAFNVGINIFRPISVNSPNLSIGLILFSLNSDLPWNMLISWPRTACTRVSPSSSWVCGRDGCESPWCDTRGRDIGTSRLFSLETEQLLGPPMTTTAAAAEFLRKWQTGIGGHREALGLPRRTWAPRSCKSFRTGRSARIGTDACPFGSSRRCQTCWRPLLDWRFLWRALGSRWTRPRRCCLTDTLVYLCRAREIWNRKRKSYIFYKFKFLNKDNIYFSPLYAYTRNIPTNCLSKLNQTA